MATITTSTQVDDLDGSAATENIVFGLDGAEYEIDLNDKNAKKLRDALANFVSHARRTDGGRRTASRVRPAKAARGAKARTAPDRAQTAAIREWARGEGYEVSERGRLSAAIVQAFEDAH